MGNVRRAAAIVALSLAPLALAVGLVRCNLPEQSPGPVANPTRVGLIRGAFVTVPSAPFDHAAFIASLTQLKFSTVVLRSAADANGEHVADRVALALELQQALNAAVFIGTYDAPSYANKPIDALLVTDPTFASCYPGGPTLDAASTVIDKLITCSADVSTKVAAALHAANATTDIGCFITQQPPLVAGLDPAATAKLASLFHDSAAACSNDGRFVGVASLLAPGAGDPASAGTFFRETLTDSGVNVLMLQDGVSQPDASTTRGASYYQGLRNALEDRTPLVVWANVEAFACADPTCATTQAATPDRFLRQLCAARARVDGIVATEYFGDLAGQSFVDASGAASDAGDAGDAAIDAQTALDDVDAAAQLRQVYLSWVDAGAPCPP